MEWCTADNGTGRRQGKGNENDPGGKRSGYKEHESRRREKKLKTCSDFKNQKKTLLKEYIEGRGHLCLLYPKFHCELSEIERVWCHSKKHTRAYPNGSTVRLREIVPKGLDSVSTEMIQKFFRTCKDYEHAYREGLIGKAVEDRVKVYKSQVT